jgi:hypothetical protein
MAVSVGLQPPDAGTVSGYILSGAMHADDLERVRKHAAEAVSTLRQEAQQLGAIAAGNDE